MRSESGYKSKWGPEDDLGGLWMACGAFVLWGLLPIYWKSLESVPPLVVAAHRFAWSFLFLLPLVLARGGGRALVDSFLRPQVLAIHFAAGLFLALNWWLYIWATVNERILDGALGYFINPLVFLLFGRLFFGESLGRRQVWAVGLAACGVAAPVVVAGVFPWVALCLALSFGAYGILRKYSPLGAITGSSLETVLWLPVALVLLWFLPAVPMMERSPVEIFLLAGSGIVTATPLLLFAAAARRINLGTLGMLQFLGPSLQFLIGWLVYGEALPLWRLGSFVLIWAAIALYISGIRRANAAAGAENPPVGR